MRKLTNKKADINLSFGVIFSIILIAVFVFAAIYAINFFLNYSKCLQVGRFYDNLEDDVSRARHSSSVVNKPFKISLPNNIDKICFANLSATITNPGEDYEALRIYEGLDRNLFLIPEENGCGMPSKKINGLNIGKIIEGENPYCIDSDGTLILTKRIYDKTVFLERG